MLAAQFEESAELKLSLARWGITREFHQALVCTQGGQLETDTINVGLEAGTFIAVMKNGTLIMGHTAEDAAQQAHHHEIPRLLN